MSREQIMERLQALLVEVTGRDDIVLTPETSWSKDLNINSFATLSMVCAIEDDFDISISNAEIRSFKTVKSVVDCILRHLG